MATYYWYNNGGDWDSFSTSNWSTSATNPRNLSPAPNAPTSADDVVFDSLSGTGIVNLISNPVCRNITATTLSTSLQFYGGTGGAALSVHGSVNLGANATFVTAQLSLTMYSTSLGNTVTIGNTSLVAYINYIGSGTFTQSASTVLNGTGLTSIGVFAGTVTFSGAITTNNIEVSGGTLNTGAFTHTITDPTVKQPRVYVGSGTLNLTSTTLNMGLAFADSIVTFYYSSGTLTTASSIINMGVSGCVNYFYGGGVTYNSVNLVGDNNAMYGSNTFSTLTVTGGAVNSAYLSIDSISVTNILTLSGNSIAPNRLFVYPNQVGGISEIISPITITLSGAGAKTFRWMDVQDVTLSVTGTAPTFTSIGDCFGNTGFTLTPTVTRYAVSGGISKNFSSTTLWSASSGGATGATVPLPQDTVNFDSNANAEVVFDMPRIGKDVTFNTGVGFVVSVSGVFYAYIFGTPNTEALNKLASIYLESRSSILVPTCSVSNLILNGKGGTYTASGLIIATYFSLIHGSFYSSGYTVSIGNISQTVGTSSASWYASTSTINCSVSFVFYTVGTISLLSSTIVFNSSGSTSLSAYSGSVFGTVNFGSNSSSQVTLTSSDDLTITKLISSGTASKRFTFGTTGTTTIGTLEINGSSSAPVLFAPATLTSSGSSATISLTNSVTTSFVAFRLITKTGAGTLNATGVADLGRNSGINFTSTLYGLAYRGTVGSNASGSFTVPSNFSGSSMLVVIGGGGGASKRTNLGGSGGSGAGALSIVSNPSVSAGQTIYYSAGAGGIGNTSAGGGSGQSGTTSWINISANTLPLTTANGAYANGGSTSNSFTASAGAGATTGLGLFLVSGASGGNGTTVGAGAGGAAGRINATIAYTGGTGSSSSGGGGGGGYLGNGANSSSSTGGVGGLNSLSAAASGGVLSGVNGTAGTAGTNGGGGGGGGGATTGTAGAGGAGASSSDFIYTSLDGFVGSGTIGPSSGGGGGGGATTSGGGGAGGNGNGVTGAGGGGGGGGRGNSIALNGAGGDGGVGLVLFVYTLAPPTRNQGSIIG
jgi:hypothetical protein